MPIGVSSSLSSSAFSVSISASDPSNHSRRCGRLYSSLLNFADNTSNSNRFTAFPLTLSNPTTTPFSRLLTPCFPDIPPLAAGGGGTDGGNRDGYGRGGGGDDEGGDNGGYNKDQALLALAQIGRSLDTLPNDLAAAVSSGRLPPDILTRYVDLDKSPLFHWLLQFAGFRERLLADDLFFAKLAMECGVGVLTKTAAEYERRRDNFFNELEIVFADVAMAIIADFMLVYLPAPTVSLRPPLAVNAGAIAKFFHNCPDNAFQIALGGASYTIWQRLGAIMRNGAKLFAVGTTSSLVGTVITNAVISAKKAVDKSAAEDIDNIPILSTSAAYGVYMAVSSNLRYQILAGVIEQRILEPMLHNHKLELSALCFAVRTGNTFLGSLLWVDYARWIGIQKNHGDEHP